MALEFRGWSRRSCIFTLTIRDADGNLVTFSAGDRIEVGIGRAGESPLVDLSSDAATANGSSVEAANPSQIELKAADLDQADIRPGFWCIQVDFFDSSANNRYLVDVGMFDLWATQLDS